MTASRGFGGGAQRRRLDAGRWHFQHGPIDCVVGVEGEPGAVAAAVEQAWARFGAVLGELVGDLPLLRADLSARAARAVPEPSGPIARRMLRACRPYGDAGTFITAMAAVAGSVAEEIVAFFGRAEIARAYVNNGGDIALHLAPGRSFDVGLVADPALARAGGPLAGRFAVDASSPARGVATSGWRGRSFSLGIADSVTVLAASASAADAAATIVANAVDVGVPGIVRRPASSLRDDSDLADRLVTCAVPTLPALDVERALAAGERVARREVAAGRIVAAVLSLQGRFVIIDGPVLEGRPAAALAARQASSRIVVGESRHVL